MPDCKYRLQEKLMPLWKRLGIEDEVLEIQKSLSRAGNIDTLESPTDAILTIFFQFGTVNAPLSFLSSFFRVTTEKLRKLFKNEDSLIRQAFDFGLFTIHEKCHEVWFKRLREGDSRVAEVMMNRLDNPRMKIIVDDEDISKPMQLQLIAPEGFVYSDQEDDV